MYATFSVWWLCHPWSAVAGLVNWDTAYGGVCDDAEDPKSEVACHTIIFLTRFVGVYFFLVSCLLASLIRAAFYVFPDNAIVQNVASVSLFSWVPTAVIAACLYVQMSVESSEQGTTPIIPMWVIIISNSPFVIGIFYVNYWELEWSRETFELNVKAKDDERSINGMAKVTDVAKVSQPNEAPTCEDHDRL